MSYDSARVRSHYPALADGWAYLDGAAGTQVPEPVIEAIASAYRQGIGNFGGAFAASIRSGGHAAAARVAVADLVGATDSDGVVLGPNMTTLTYRFADALADTWSPGDEIVLTRLDHDANVWPWVQAAERAGVQVRWVDPELPSTDLPAAAFDAVIGERTRLVALTAASNVTGARPDVAAVSKRAHAVGALTYVDGVHSTPHGPVDVAALGADLYATSSYKWSGPHLGAVVADPGLLGRLRPRKLASSPDAVPWRFEPGTPPYADLAGMAAAVDHLAALGADVAVAADAAPVAATNGTSQIPPPAPSRRERIIRSMTAVERYENELFEGLLDGLGAMEHVQLIGAPASRTATAFFRVRGHDPTQVAEHCARARVNVWAGHMYAWELTALLGIRDSGGAVRAGLVHYNDISDVDRLLEAVADMG